MKKIVLHFMLLITLAFAGIFTLPSIAQAQIDCELVKWPRADADAHWNHNSKFDPTQRCINIKPPEAKWPDNQTPQPTQGLDCERRSCFDAVTLSTKVPAHGFACVYFPCQMGPGMTSLDPKAGVAIICDDRGCQPLYGSAEPEPDLAKIIEPCIGCDIKQCEDAARILRENHENFERAIMSAVSEEMRKHRLWLREIFFKSEVLKALTMFTTQMSAIGMEQIMMIGQFLDAKQVMETWRTFQQLQHQAHRDYTPSQDFCWFGTNVRSLAASEEKSWVNSFALSRFQMDRHLGKPGTPGASHRANDKFARWNKFTETYCDPKDNNWTRSKTGLSIACNAETPPEPKFVNIDIDYTRLVERPHTYQEVDFSNGIDTDEEKNIFALSQNLYGNNVLTRSADRRSLQNDENQYLYLSLRSIAAKRSVAEDSFNSIIGLKSKGSPDMTEEPNTSAFLYALLKELGMKNEDIEKTIGKNPSYYAQLEILAKNIYQNPDFYANLYDTPVNVQRKSVALRAIERMLDQAILESKLRQEMSIAVLTSSKLNKYDRAVAREIAGDQ